MPVTPNALFFCMACGCEFRAPLVFGEGRNYGQSPPDIATPSYCRADECAEARKRFDATCKRIMRGEYSR